jgi:tRNA pseudouridine55 synthase
MDGILNIYKEKGYTSHDVVAKLRGILHQKKIGHTGTLDPDAVGVLPVCLGKATKVCELLTDKDKSYRAVCQLGVETDTQDITGQVLNRASFAHVTGEDLEKCLDGFRGEIEQIPPMYSAIKVNGKKLYQLAREGKTVERKPRQVHIYSLTLVDVELEKGSFTFDVTCSKGTYIRTLCHDIGQALGCFGTMASLVRTRVSCFALEDALTLSQIQDRMTQGEEAVLEKLLPVDSLFPEYPAYEIKKEFAPKLANGNPLLSHFLSASGKHGKKIISLGELSTGARLLVYDEQGNFKAIYKKEDRDLRVEKMF